jgi:hypothetical protein
MDEAASKIRMEINSPEELDSDQSHANPEIEIEAQARKDESKLKVPEWN